MDHVETDEATEAGHAGSNLRHGGCKYDTCRLDLPPWAALQRKYEIKKQVGSTAGIELQWKTYVAEPIQALLERIGGLEGWL